MKKLLSLLARRPEVPATRLVAILSAYFLVFMNISFWRFVFTHVSVSGFADGVFLLSLPILIFTVIYAAFCVLLLPYVGKPLMVLILIVSAAVNYLTYQFGVFIDADMIRNTFETNPGEVKDLITLRSVSWLVLLGI